MAEKRNLREWVQKMTEPRATRARVIVIDHPFVDVQILSSSSVIKNVAVLGNVDDLSLGQQVIVDWFDDRPYVLSGTNVPEKEPEAAAGEGIVAASERNLIAVLGPNNSFEQYYSTNEAGLEAAIEDVFYGCILYIPTCTLSHDIVLPAGVHVHGVSKNATRINGSITGAATVENLSIFNISSGAELVGVDISQSSLIRNVNIYINNGGGDAFGVRFQGGLELYVRHCEIEARGAGLGYGVAYAGGTGLAYVFSSKVKGSTSPFRSRFV